MRKPFACLFILLLVLFQANEAFCVNKGFLFFSGKVSSSDKITEQVTIRVLKQNQEVTSFNTRPDGVFSVYLDLHSSYEIRVTSSMHRDALIRLSTALPSGTDQGKFELAGDIALPKKSDKQTGYVGYVWFSRQEKKFILSSQNAPQVAESSQPKHSTAKTPQDPGKIYNSGEKNALAVQSESEKLRQEQIRNHQSVKAEAGSALLKTIAESEKKKKNIQQPEVCNEEKKEEDKYKKVTSILVCDGAIKTRLRRVEYTWGSIYYYKNGEQVSEKEFEKLASKQKLSAK